VKIDRLDHLVLTVQDIERTVAFYVSVLGMRSVRFAGDRVALSFGQQKINLHSQSAPLEPHARKPMPGSADLCLVSSTPVSEMITELENAGVVIEVGPVQRTGATGPIVSVYIRDPDENLIELCNYLP
jgi:catechol 2,3-dioxygenase-like lactoylglutathione lyase family enzyme